jgi:hypothetical protein
MFCYLLTRARIRASFDGQIISLKTTRHSNTIDNVKAKIDNVNTKIQNKEEKRSWSRPTLAIRPIFGQLVASPTSFPLEEPPRQVSSHEKSPPRTTSLDIARQVSTSHEKSGPDWYVGLDARHEHRHRRVWRNESPRHAGTTAGGHEGGLPRQEP